MSLDLSTLLAAALATRKPIRREVKVGNDTVVAHFLDLPAGEVRELLRADGEGDSDARLIAATLCNEAGELQLTTQQAQQLRLPYLLALVSEALTVVGALKEDKENAKKPSSPTAG